MKILIFLLLGLTPIFAAVKSGDQAPPFELKNQDGETVRLSDFKDKIVVLEWTNYECPFVKKFYHSGKMQELQTDAKAKGVVWLSINSSAEGKQGHFDKETLKTRKVEEKANPNHYLVDADGKVGKLYGAKTTPHMFIIDSSGALAYQGAIDSIRSTKAKDIPKATNYVAEALEAVMKGKAVAKSKTTSYGCSVKY